MSEKVSISDAKELEDYKKQAEDNPQMQQEMKQASDSFSADYADGDSPASVTDPSNYSSTPVVNNYYYSNSYDPYPYWFSYPYWYATPVWYPMPYYYYTGYYYGPGGRLVIFGLPSRMYARWFYGGSYRRYPYLYQHCHAYYHVYNRNVTEGRMYRNYGRYNQGYSGNNSYQSTRPQAGSNYGTQQNGRPRANMSNYSAPETKTNRSTRISRRASEQLNIQKSQTKNMDNGSRVFQRRSGYTLGTPVRSYSGHVNTSPVRSTHINSGHLSSGHSSGHVSSGRISSGHIGGSGHVSSGHSSGGHVGGGFHGGGHGGGRGH